MFPSISLALCVTETYISRGAINIYIVARNTVIPIQNNDINQISQRSPPSVELYILAKNNQPTALYYIF